VLTTRFLQDTATALNLPLSTLTGDLETVRANAEEAARRRAEFLERQETHQTAPRPTASIDASPLESSPFLEDDFIADEGDEEFVPTEDSMPIADDASEEPTLPTTNELDVAQNLTGAFCELLAHHFTDEEVMACLLQHLPPSFIRNPYADKLYSLALDASISKRSYLTPDHSDANFSNFLAKLFATADRITPGSDDLTPLSNARDIITRYWLREFEYRAKMAPPDSLEAYQQTLYQKRLKDLSWEAAAPFMDALAPTFAPAIKVTTSASQMVAPPPPEESEAESPAEEVEPMPVEANSPTLSPEPDEWLSDEDEINIYDTL
jgi:hypothetical protein